MFPNRRLVPLLLALALLLSSLPPLAILQAQNSSITISVAIPEWMASNFPADVFAQFEADNPGVKVNLVKTGSDSYFPPAAYDSEQFFNNAAKYVASADVLHVTGYTLSPEASRAGYFLDLSPLVRGDTSLNTDDFVAGAWQAFQWDGGIWAMPATLDVIILNYDPAAFDKAGVAYPTGKWTLNDLADAARKLTIKDADGKVTTPGIIAWNHGPLFRSIMGEGFYDATTGAPQFDKPALIQLLDMWGKLQEEGVTGNTFRGDYQSVPMRLDQSFSIASNMGNAEKPRNGSLLPGGKAGLSVEGFAVSGGTQYPEQAYALVKFIASSPALASRFFGLMPARKSLVGAEPPGDTPRFTPKFSPENQAVIDEALANSLSPSEYRFIEYISKALNEMGEKKLDAKTVLLEAQNAAVNVMQTAADKRNAKAVVVSTPVPTPVLSAGQVAINFKMMAYISPLPNRDRWDQVIKEFTESDPQVRHINLDTGFGSGGPDEILKFDCFSQPFNFISDSTQDKLLALDPLLSADSTFDKNDVIGNSLAQMQRNNRTLGLPLYIQPSVLRYNSESFTRAGIKPPENGWTIDAFNDALKALKVGPSDPAPFVPHDLGGSYMLQLIAAYGGLPLDFRTTPITVNFTDPANVDATRQVLDLARNGYIKYVKLASMGGGGGMGGPETDPIYTDNLSMLNYYRGMGPGNQSDPYRAVTYPKGTRFLPVSYSIGAAYISANAANPEACYRWISTLSKHPELFWAMPARRSVLDSAGVTSQGADVAAFYKDFDKALQDPSTLIVSAQFDSAGDFVLTYFLNRVFDRYVLENADLEAELKQAETYAKAYQECIAKIPPSTASTTKAMMDYYKQFTDCAVKIDPSLKSVLQPEQ